MDILLAEIQNDIDWRISEISNLKTIPVRYGLEPSHKKSIRIHSIPAFYAIWEGFLKNTFELLTDYLNNLNLTHETVHINIITHAIENKYNLSNERKSFEKKIKFIENISSVLNASVKIQQGIPTEANANYKVTNKILERFNIEPLNNSYKNQLDKLLHFRNKISHGENSITVSNKEITDFSLLVNNLMYDILLLIEKYLKEEKYTKPLT